MKTTTVEKVYSPIKDDNIKNDIKNSPIWKECYHTNDTKPTVKQMFVYTIKFDGLVPIQVMKIDVV
jgi:hypothetical protein